MRGFALLDQHTCGKAGELDGREDAVVVTDRHAFVLDGVGSYPSFEVAGSAPGRLAVDTVRPLLEQLPADATLRQTVDSLSAAIAEVLATHRVDLASLPRPPAVQLTGYSAALRQVWRVGDTSVRIDGKEHLRDQQFDLLCNQMRTMLRHAAVLSGRSVEASLSEDPMLPFLPALVAAQAQLLNRDSDSPYAFGWVTASPTPGRFLETFTVPQGSEVVLATDGHLGAPATLRAAEAALATELARPPLADMRRLADRDALGAGMVSFDDRAYVRLRAL